MATTTDLAWKTHGQEPATVYGVAKVRHDLVTEQ